jgi:hypothetical protein
VDAPVGVTDHPSMKRMGEGLFLLHDVRTVHGADRNPAGAPPDSQAEPIMLAVPQYIIWKDTNLNVDVAAEAQDLAKANRREELLKKMSREELPVAVAVTEQGAPAGNPGDPHAFMRRQQTPRAVIFGDATWVCNHRMGDNNIYEAFAGSLAWLRDRPATGGKEPESKERKAYILRPKDPDAFDAHVRFLPLTLLTVGILGLGAGVWVVRRR